MYLKSTRRIRPLIAGALVALISLFVALAPSGASASPTPTGSTVSGASDIEPDHAVTCDHWPDVPYWAFEDQAKGNVYWTCSSPLDIHEYCAWLETWVADWGEWTQIGYTYCTESTAISGKVTAQGTCVGSPGRWVHPYRIHFFHNGFHGNWFSGEGWSSTKNLAC
jgi:hypothetical protein